MQKRLLFLLWALSASVHLLQAQLPQKGFASYYADKFQGRRTTSGERYHKDSFTAAHRTLPFGTWVKVTNLRKNLSVIVKINDRGPVPRRRKIDLSKAAARRIGLIGTGVTLVKIELVKWPEREKPGIKPDGTKEEDKPIVRSDKIDIKYTVQTGIFREYANAKRMRNDLQQKGFASADIDKIRVHDETMYRLGLGTFTRKDEAEEIVKKLKLADYESYVIRL